ncbi:hypothetical protein [Streptomyces sp. NBC_00996]|uniref:hypothetical protein n=1 Tax=Streptomyces sp. NBC_00996 TaxID=2903710 RepID=UPI00386CA598|nr:hypothetical protein OG390_47370 [Streptomyces sp. NBC_00996]
MLKGRPTPWTVLRATQFHEFAQQILDRVPGPLAIVQVVSAFREACETGDLDALVALLDPDVESRSDGGGEVRAALRPVVGQDKVTRLILGLMRKEPDVELVEEDVNGTPGMTVRLTGTTIAVLAMDVHEGLITNLWLVLNPDKLHAWSGDDTR